MKMTAIDISAIQWQINFTQEQIKERWETAKERERERSEPLIDCSNYISSRLLFSVLSARVATIAMSDLMRK
jgi:hypothetical protein